MKIVTFQSIDSLYEVLMTKEYSYKKEIEYSKTDNKLCSCITKLINIKTGDCVERPIWGLYQIDGEPISIYSNLHKAIKLMAKDNLSMMYILNIPDNEIILNNFYCGVLRGENSKNVFKFLQNETVQVCFSKIKLKNIEEAYTIIFDRRNDTIEHIEKII